MDWVGYPVAQEFLSLLLDVDDGDYHRGAFEFGENRDCNRGLECVGPKFVDSGGRYAGLDFSSEAEQP